MTSPALLHIDSQSMLLNTMDWIVIAAYFLALVIVTFAVRKDAGESAENYFLGGRKSTWWLLGFSMVATTFSTDTPNLVTDLVRTNGVAGNWTWWAFLLTGMLTVFVYSRLWRRSGVLTDIEFYELRYSGFWARFLRVFRAIYLGCFFNILIMASVTLAAIKIGAIVLGLSPLQTILAAVLVVLLICTVSGLKGVLVTDSVLFVLAMAGALVTAYYAVNALEGITNGEVVGLSGMIQALKSDPVLENKLCLMPTTPELWITLFVIPIGVQWWASYYPGSEPGGGGYLVQRMLAAKDEKNALYATLFFTVMHYAVRPWPWIIVALASLVAFPDLTQIAAKFPHLPEHAVRHDAAYSAMISFVPHGMLGLVMASLLGAYMSTISTQINWGASYLSLDVYKRAIKKDATSREVVFVGKVVSAVSMLLMALLALYLKSAMQIFGIIIMVGAGTGLIFVLRWFWWRVNALCEFVGMTVSFVVALLLAFTPFGNWCPSTYHLVVNVIVTTVAWVTTAYLSSPTEKKVLYRFVETINPAGPGWNTVRQWAKDEGVTLKCQSKQENLTLGILQTVLGTVAVFAALFGVGKWIYGEIFTASVFGGVTVLTFVLLTRTIVRKS